MTGLNLEALAMSQGYVLRGALTATYVTQRQLTANIDEKWPTK